MVARIARVSVLTPDDNPSSTTEDFSVSSSRDEKINAIGMACGVVPTMWELVGIINVSFVLLNQLSVVHHQANKRGCGGSGGSEGSGGSGMSSLALASLGRALFTMPNNFSNE